MSDNVNDKRNSVYSRAAALERKIEIMSVSYKNLMDSVYPKISFDKESIDLGKRKNGIPIISDVPTKIAGYTPKNNIRN